MSMMNESSCVIVMALGIQEAGAQFKPELVVYKAGSDVLHGDP